MNFLPSLRRNRSPLTSNFDELFNSAFSQFPSSLATNGNLIALDVEEKDDEYIVEAEVAGVNKEDVDVTLQDKVLTIQTKSSGESEKKDKNYLCKERWEGSSSRSVELPLADEGKVNAKLKDGILKIKINKLPESQTKRVAIQ